MAKSKLLQQGATSSTDDRCATGKRKLSFGWHAINASACIFIALLLFGLPATVLWSTLQDIIITVGALGMVALACALATHNASRRLAKPQKQGRTKFSPFFYFLNILISIVISITTCSTLMLTTEYLFQNNAPALLIVASSLSVFIAILVCSILAQKHFLRMARRQATTASIEKNEERIAGQNAHLLLLKKHWATVAILIFAMIIVHQQIQIRESIRNTQFAMRNIQRDVDSIENRVSGSGFSTDEVEAQLLSRLRTNKTLRDVVEDIESRVDNIWKRVDSIWNELNPEKRRSFNTLRYKIEEIANYVERNKRDRATSPRLFQ